MAKPPKYLFYLGGGALALVIYTFSTAPDTSTPPRKANNSFQGVSSATKKKGDELFRPEDYTASFAPVNVVPRDAFKPLVAKTSKTLSGQVVPLLPNGIPAAFAGGDANWIYTGNAEVDGVPNALLENTSTEEGVFLRPGERWKGLTLSRVSSNQIEVLGPTGQRRSIHIAEDPDTELSGTVATGTLPAVVPNGAAPLAGAIGAPATTTAPATGGDGRANRPGRRNRRNSSGTTFNGGNAPTFGNP